MSSPQTKEFLREMSRRRKQSQQQQPQQQTSSIQIPQSSGSALPDDFSSSISPSSPTVEFYMSPPRQYSQHSTALATSPIAKTPTAALVRSNSDRSVVFEGSYLTIVTQDDHEFIIPREVAFHSEWMRRLFDDGNAVVCPLSGNIKISTSSSSSSSTSSSSTATHVSSPWRERFEGLVRLQTFSSEVMEKVIQYCFSDYLLNGPPPPLSPPLTSKSSTASFATPTSMPATPTATPSKSKMMTGSSSSSKKGVSRLAAKGSPLVNTNVRRVLFSNDGDQPKSQPQRDPLPSGNTSSIKSKSAVSPPKIGTPKKPQEDPRKERIIFCFDIGGDIAIEVLMAAHYLGIRGLHDLACRMIAANIESVETLAGLPPESILQIYSYLQPIQLLYIESQDATSSNASNNTVKNTPLSSRALTLDTSFLWHRAFEREGWGVEEYVYDTSWQPALSKMKVFNDPSVSEIYPAVQVRRQPDDEDFDFDAKDDGIPWKHLYLQREFQNRVDRYFRTLDAQAASPSLLASPLAPLAFSLFASRTDIGQESPPVSSPSAPQAMAQPPCSPSTSALTSALVAAANASIAAATTTMSGMFLEKKPLEASFVGCLRIPSIITSEDSPPFVSLSSKKLRGSHSSRSTPTPTKSTSTSSTTSTTSTSTSSSSSTSTATTKSPVARSPPSKFSSPAKTTPTKKLVTGDQVAASRALRLSWVDGFTRSFLRAFDNLHYLDLSDHPYLFESCKQAYYIQQQGVSLENWSPKKSKVDAMLLRESEELFKWLTEESRVATLCLTKCGLEDTFACRLYEVMQKSGNEMRGKGIRAWTSLDLSSNSITRNGLTYLCQALFPPKTESFSGPFLQNLSLASNTIRSSRKTHETNILAEVFSAVSRSNNLRLLDLGYNELHVANIPSSSLSLLSANKSLAYLLLNDNPIGAAHQSLMLASPAVPSPPTSPSPYPPLPITTTTTTISQSPGSINPIAISSPEWLRAFIVGLPSTIRYLSLANCGLEEAHMSILATTLSLTMTGSARRITSLDLSDNNMRDADVFLASLLYSNQGLTSLDLSDNHLWDVAGKAIEDAIVKNPNLLHLNLERNMLRHSAVMIVNCIVRNLDSINLQSINLDANQISSTDIHTIKQLLGPTRVSLVLNTY